MQVSAGTAPTLINAIWPRAQGAMSGAALVAIVAASFLLLDTGANAAIMPPLAATLFWAVLAVATVASAWVFGTRQVLLAVVGTALMAISAKINVPMYPVPMTMQTFAVLVIAMAFGARLAGATLLLYLAEGAVGLPVFASGAGALYLAGPTGGYLFGFLVAAVLVGWLAERDWDRNVVLTFCANLAGTAIIFTLGVLWLSTIMGSLEGALAAGFTPFVVGAFAKSALAAALLPTVWKLLPRR